MTELRDDGAYNVGLKGMASAYVLCPHLQIGNLNAFQFTVNGTSDGITEWRKGVTE
jgi:hypothetical protein